MIQDVIRPATLWDYPKGHYDRIGQINYLALARLITAEWIKRGVGECDTEAEAYYQELLKKERQALDQQKGQP